MQAWLDSQATYQLSLQKAKQAADAAAYASQQVEKLNSALTTAQSSLDAVTAQTADEKNGVLDERALIKELMTNVGAAPIANSPPNPSFLRRPPLSRIRTFELARSAQQAFQQPDQCSD